MRTKRWLQAGSIAVALLLMSPLGALGFDQSKVLAQRSVDARGSAAEASAPSGDLRVDLTVQDTGGNTSLLLSPDGRLFAAIDSFTVVITDAATGRKLRKLAGHEARVLGIAFTPDGHYLVSAGEDNTMRTWDVESGREVRRFELPPQGTDSGAGPLAISGDGKRIFFVPTWNGGAVILDAVSGEEIKKLSAPSPSGLAFSLAAPSSGSIFAWAMDGAIAVADGQTGEVIHEFEVKLEEDSDFIGNIAISANGATLVAETSSRMVSTFDLVSGELLGSFSVPEESYGVAVSPDGAEIALGGRAGVVYRYNLTGSLLSEARPADDPAYGLLYSADGSSLYVLAKELFVLDRATDQLTMLSPQVAMGAAYLDFSADGNVIAGIPSGGIVWNVDTGAASTRLVDRGIIDRQYSTGSFAPASGLWAVVARPEGGGAESNELHIYDTNSERPLSSVTANDESRIVIAKLSADGALVATRHDDDTVRVRDTATLTEVLVKRGEEFGEVAIAADHKFVAAETSSDVTVWSTMTGETVQEFKPYEDAYMVGRMEFSPDGSRLAIGSLFEGAGVWDVASGKELWRQKEDGDAFFVRFSPDGTRLLHTARDGQLVVRASDTGKVLLRLDVESATFRFAMSPDNSKIAIAASGAVWLYSADDGQLLARVSYFPDGEWVALTEEGFFNASEHGGENLSLVRGLQFHSIDQAYDALYRPDLLAAKLAGDPDGLVAAAAAKLDLEVVVNSGAAPRVMIASPAAGSTIAEDVVEVAADITDSGGGIGKIEWRVNGVTLGIDTRGFDRLTIDGQQAASGGTDVVAAPPVRVSQTLTLDPGDNLIEVVAYNEQGLLASEPARITVNWDGISVSTPPRLFVLSVGVNDYYDSRLALTYAAPDAQAIGAAFATAGRDLYESVEVTTVLDADVTATHLGEVFDNLGAKVRPRDVFVLFMAGHGKTQDGRYYFLPQDFRYTDESSIASGGINQDQFQTWLARIPARKSVLLYDTCDSGALTNAATNRGLEEVAALARMTRAMGRTVLSASTDDAPALEGYNGHGVFTFALLQALGEGDANGDGTIEVTELAGAIDKAVPEISYAAFNLRQIPQMSIVGSDFPLTSKAMVLAAAAPASSDVPATIPSAPTHVVIQPTVVASEPGGAGSGVTLTVGAGVRVLKADGEWSHVAREGRALGYVRNEALVAIQ